MKKRLKLKSYVIPCLYLVLFSSIVVGATLITKTLKGNDEKTTPEYTYVSSTILSQEVPVINETIKMIKPYTNENVTIGKTYYDYKAESKAQESSITYYDGSYIQNSGVDYVLEETFDVVSVLNGTVVNVKQDDILGNIVEIKHENNYVTTYQSLSEVTVKKDDIVTQGQIIGKSGSNKLDKDMGNHLHFEVYVNGQVVDPSLYVDKEIKKEQ